MERKFGRGLILLLLFSLTLVVLAGCVMNLPCQHRDADDNSLCDKCDEPFTDGCNIHRDADDNGKSTKRLECMVESFKLPCRLGL